MSNIEIDKNSGFCFGVVNAIEKAEEELNKGGTLYCLGDIVHNEQEVGRLAKMGLITINHDEFKKLRDVKVMLRAHGEPPFTYETAKKNNITLIDASCPVVLKLQSRIENAYKSNLSNNTQIVIYGKKGHAEVNGLVGQTNDSAIVIENENDLDKLDFSKNIYLFSQTTKSLDGFNRLIEKIADKMEGHAEFKYFDTICRQVSNRIPNIIKFAVRNDIVIFVSGEKSSNGKELFKQCKDANPNSFFVSSPEDLKKIKIDISKKIGICGATSTPTWLMETIADKINEEKNSNDDKFSVK